jgi:CheY-like chemotaxis protein
MPAAVRLFWLMNAPPDGREVLVVDDEADLAFALGLSLELSGYRVRSAASGEEALTLIDAHEPDAIVLDLRLPGMDGWEVLSRLAESGRFPRIPVVIVSAQVDAQTSSMAAGLGCHTFLAKPVTATDLNRALQAAIPGAITG